MPEATAVRTARRRRRSPNLYLWLGATLLGLFAALALFGGRIAPYDPTAQDLLALLEPPSAAHPLGTDNVGRDILSRIIAGTRFTLSIALASLFLAGIGGVLLGSIAGYFGGITDRIVTGVIDLLLTVPNIVLAIAIATVAGATATGLTIAITASFIPPLARLVRGRVVMAPGIAISLLVLAFNTFGDGLRDYFDPNANA